MPLTYRHIRSGRVETRDAPDPALDSNPRWQLEGAADTSSPADARPAANASTAVWREYAIAQGVPADEADEASRDELRARFPQE